MISSPDFDDLGISNRQLVPFFFHSESNIAATCNIVAATLRHGIFFVTACGLKGRKVATGTGLSWRPRVSKIAITLER